MRLPWNCATKWTAITATLTLCFLLLASRADAQCENCSAAFDEGETVTLTAAPEPGSVFAGWEGDPECEAGQNPLEPTETTVTMDKDINCVARFELMQANPMVTFQASCSDPQDGDITPSLVFTSDLQGELGTGGSFAVAMIEGAHQVGAECCDSVGECYNETRTITVDLNDPPTVIWDLPADGICVGDGCPTP